MAVNSVLSLFAKLVDLAQNISSLLHKGMPIRANIGAKALF